MTWILPDCHSPFYICPLPSYQAEKRRRQVEAAAKAQAAAEEAQRALQRFQQQQQQAQQGEQGQQAQQPAAGGAAGGSEPGAPAGQGAAPMDVDAADGGAAAGQAAAAAPAAGDAAPTITPRQEDDEGAAISPGGQAAGGAAAAPLDPAAAATAAAIAAAASKVCWLEWLAGMVDPAGREWLWRGLGLGLLVSHVVWLIATATQLLRTYSSQVLCSQLPFARGQEGEDRVAEAERARQRAEQARRDLEANSGEEPRSSCALVLPGSAALHV